MILSDFSFQIGICMNWFTDQNISEEIQTLESYLRCIYYGREKTTVNKAKTIQCEVHYDLLDWSKSKELSSLENFKRPTKYAFQKTPFSEIDKIQIWNSFGFYRDKNFSGLPGNASRLYMSKLRREVEVL